MGRGKRSPGGKNFVGVDLLDEGQNGGPAAKANAGHADKHNDEGIDCKCKVPGPTQKGWRLHHRSVPSSDLQTSNALHRLIRGDGLP